MTIYCTYLTVYTGNKLPPFYIGYSTESKVQNGYKGSVSSKKYQKIWKYETSNHPNLFKTLILSKHSTREEAMKKESLFLKTFKVHVNPMYINMAVHDTKFFFDRTGMLTSNETRKKQSQSHLGKSRSDATKMKISLGKKGKPAHPNSKLAASITHKGKIESLETRARKSESKKGKPSANRKPVFFRGEQFSSMAEAANKHFPNMDISDARKKIKKEVMPLPQ